MTSHFNIKKMVEIHDLIYVLLVLAFIVSMEMTKKVYRESNCNPTDQTWQATFLIIGVVLFVWSSVGIVTLLVARAIELIHGVSVIHSLIRRKWFISAFVVFVSIVAMLRSNLLGVYID